MKLVIENDILMALCMSLVKAPTVDEKIKLNRYKKKFVAPARDHYLTVVAQCDLCGATKSVTFNRLWDERCNFYRTQLNDVLDETALSITTTLHSNVCNKCARLLDNYNSGLL